MLKRRLSALAAVVAISGIALGTTTVPATPASAQTDARPTAVISTPSHGTYGAKPMLFTGTAGDDAQVTLVSLQIYRQSDGAFYNGASNSWSTTYPSWGQLPNATITSGLRTPNASWQYQFNPPDVTGGYTVVAVSYDNTYNFGVSPAIGVGLVEGPSPTTVPSVATTTTVVSPPAPTVVATTVAPTTPPPPPPTVAPTIAPTTAAPTTAPIATTIAPPTSIQTSPNPTIRITAPAFGSTLPKPVLLAGTAADNLQVTGVALQIYRWSDRTFYNGATGTWSLSYPPYGQLPIATVTSGLRTPNATWQYSFAPPETSGGYTVTAVVYDNSNNFGVSDAFALGIDGVSTGPAPTTVPPITVPPATKVTTTVPQTTVPASTTPSTITPPPTTIAPTTTAPAATTTRPATTTTVAPTTTRPATTTTTVAPTTTRPATTTTTVAPTTTRPATTTTLPATTPRAPAITITSPANGWIGPKPAVLSGAADDDAVVTQVSLQIYRPSTGQFYNGATGGWSTTYPAWGQLPDAVITSGVGTRNVTWTYSFAPPETAFESYTVVAVAYDNSNNFGVSVPHGIALNGTTGPTTTGPRTPTTVAVAPSTTIAAATTTRPAAPTTTSPAPTTIAPPPTTIVPPPTTPPPSGEILNTNPTMNGTASWVLVGSSYDASVSRTAGSGSVRFPGLGSVLQSATIVVTPGREYTFSTFIRSADWPSGSLSLAVLEVTEGGAFVRMVTPSLVEVAPAGVNGWYEAATVVVAPTRYVKVIASRADYQLGSGALWLDDLTFTEGVQTQVKDTNKVPFNGTQTRTDALGNWSVLENGVWKPWIPFCISTDSLRTDWSIYARVGFNCDIWSGFTAWSAERAKAAGLRSFFQISQYTLPAGWALNNTADLRAKIDEVNRSSAADYVAGYWWDHEGPYSPYSTYQSVLETVKSYDTVNGVRRRPIVGLSPSTFMRSFNTNGVPFADYTASYPGRYGDRLLAQTLDGTRAPQSMCVMGFSSPWFRAILYSCLAHGARSVNVWRDGGAQGPLEQQPFFADLPALRREIDLMAPVLRQPESSTWRLTSSTGNRVDPLAWSVREVNGVAHIIMGNMGGAQNVTFAITNGAYAVGEIRDYFTNALVATAVNGQFSFAMSGADVGTGSRVLKLVPR